MMTTENMATLAMLATILFFAYVGLIVGYGVVLFFLRKHGQVARPILTPSYSLLGSAAAGLCVLAGTTRMPDWRSELSLGIVGTLLLVMPGIISAILLLRRTLPPTLQSLARPITIGAVLAAVTLGFSVLLAAQARRIMAYNNPNESAVRMELAKKPDDAAPHMSLGNIDIGHGDYVQAVPEFQTVVSLEPGNGEASFMLAHALMRIGRTQEAWDIYTRLSAQNDSEGWGRASRRYLAQRSSIATTVSGGARGVRNR